MRPKTVKEARALWSEIARRNNWYREPFPVQIWLDENGNLLASYSAVALKKDEFRQLNKKISLRDAKKIMKKAGAWE